MQALLRSRKLSRTMSCISKRKVKAVCQRFFVAWKTCATQRRRAAAEEAAAQAQNQRYAQPVLFHLVHEAEILQHVCKMTNPAFGVHAQRCHMVHGACRQAAEFACGAQARRAEDLQSEFHSEMERFDLLRRTLTAPLVQQTVETRAFDVYAWACKPFADVLPARCGHCTVQANLNGQSCVLILGGRDAREWQASALTVSFPCDQSASSTPDTLDLQISQVETNCSRALSLVEFAACGTGNNQTIICGGRAQDRECNEIWIGNLSYNVVEGRQGIRIDVASRCEQEHSSPPDISCSGSPTLAWSKIDVHASSLSGRCQHTISYDDANHKAIVFGGYSTAKGHLGDVWVIELKSQRVWQPSDHGQLPSARRGHTAQVLRSKLWVIGGADHTGALADSYCLDLETWLWCKV